MPDVFTKRKRSEVMSRIRGRGNKETEIALAKLLRKNGVKGWRRQQKLRVEGQKRRAKASRPTNVRIDFLFPKEHVAVFVDGCFWHGCPKHSPPARWLKKSSMGEERPSAVSYQPSAIKAQVSAVREQGATYQTEAARQRSFPSAELRAGYQLRMTAGSKRTGKAFWREKMAANMRRDRFVTGQLRRRGWRVVRIWEHELTRNPARCVQRIVRLLRWREAAGRVLF